MVEIRNATKEDVHRFYKGAPFYSARAVVAVKDGEPVGIGGVCRVGSQMVVFTDFDDASGLSRKDIVRAARKVLEIINRYAMVLAYADPAKKTALGFGAHFGFEKTGSTSSSGDILMRVNHGTAKRTRPTGC